MFPGASDTTESADSYTIVGAPLERSVSFLPGTRFGPQTIRKYAAGFEDYDHRTEQHFTSLAVGDAGDIHAWNDAEEYLTFLAGELRDIVSGGAQPILLGGEHTVTIAGVQATSPSIYICIDAHLDLREAYDGDPWSHATTNHHVADHVDELVIIGARAGAEAEWDRVRGSSQITAISVEEVTDWVSTTLPTLLANESVYLSIDIDGIDPGYAPATGTREPVGLHPAIVRDIIDLIAPHGVGYDIVEVTDTDTGETATLAAKLLREWIFQHAHHT